MNETNPLREKLENTVITKTFNVSGMPLAIWEEVNDFCKQEFGDNRWTMIHTLKRAFEEDWKYQALYNEIEDLKAKVALLENKEVEPSKPFKTFGSR